LDPIHIPLLLRHVCPPQSSFACVVLQSACFRVSHHKTSCTYASSWFLRRRAGRVLTLVALSQGRSHVAREPFHTARPVAQRSPANLLRHEAIELAQPDLLCACDVRLHGALPCSVTRRDVPIRRRRYVDSDDIPRPHCSQRRDKACRQQCAHTRDIQDARHPAGESHVPVC
jgi:hypothetical protein